MAKMSNSMTLSTRYSLSTEQQGAETFHHPNNEDKAEIDYILMNSTDKQILVSLSVESETALNTSDHIPVVGTLYIAPKIKSKEKIKIKCKPKWDKCNRFVYKNTVRNHLMPFETFIPSLNSHIYILQPLCHLNAVLKQATLDTS